MGDNMFSVVVRILFLYFGMVSAYRDLTLDELYNRVRSLTGEHSDVSELLEIGRSVENRPIYVVKIQKGKAPDSTVVVEFGIHARELASPASGLYLLEKLITNAACSGLLERIRWYIIPVLNPDGYNYVKETGELWRKNRAIIPSSKCVGVDLNRNFAVGWENKTDPEYYCDEIYCGQKPISEPESIALKKFLDRIVPNEKVKAYLAVHTCFAGIYYPYGYKKASVPNYVELEALGKLMQSSIKNVAGFHYDIGPAWSIGIGGGGVDEWVYDTYHIPVVYTFELWGSEESSERCFFPNVTETERLLRESFAGVIALATYVSPQALTVRDRGLCDDTRNWKPS